jgi:hypothetical protein
VTKGEKDRGPDRGIAGDDEGPLIDAFEHIAAHHLIG